MPQDKLTVTQALEPCPFCASDDLLTTVPPLPVYCRKCHARAVDWTAWNTRAVPRPEPLTDEAYFEAVAKAKRCRAMGRDPVADAIERILFRRVLEERLDGYLKETGEECSNLIAAIAVPRPAVEVSEEPTRDDIAQVLFEQRQPPYSWEDALVAEPESDAGSLLSICRDDADAVLARLAIPRPDPLPVGRTGVVERTEYRELLSYLAEANEHEAYHAIHALLARDTGWSMECEELREENTRQQAVMDQMAEALKEIAQQKTYLETVEEDEFCGGDFVNGYDCCVNRARKALTACTEIRSTMRGGHG